MKKLTLLAILLIFLLIVCACGEGADTDTSTKTGTDIETEKPSDGENENNDVDSSSETESNTNPEVESNTNTDAESETDSETNIDDEHVHVEEIVSSVAPTCTETGLTEGKKCSTCGEILVEQTTVDAKGHTEEIIPAVEPTCTEAGLTEGKKCSACGEIIVEQETVPTKGHTEETIEGKDATCTETGLTEGKKCSKCGEILVEQETVDSKGHKYENSYTCSECEFVSAKESTGLEFKLNTETDTYYVNSIGSCTDTDIVIPYTYEGKAVTSIGDYAFFNCTSLTSMTIPDSVTGTGYLAFKNCTSLTSVNYLGTMEQWCNIEFNNYNTNPLYYANDLYINGELVTELVIPDTITEIKLGTFAGGNFTKVTIHDNVTSIGGWAFDNCKSLTSVTIGDSVTSIGGWAFYGCFNLTSVTIGDSVTSIGNDAFYNCSKLTYNEYDNAHYIGNKDNPYVVLIKAKDTSITSCTINENTKVIHSEAFDGCASLTSVTIPDSVTSIGNSAFSGCTSLTSITIGDSVTSIGDRAFTGCTALAEINFNARALNDLSVNNSVFLNAGIDGSGIKVTIGKDVTKIPAYLFYPYYMYGVSSGSPKITSVTFEEGGVCKSIGNSAFDGCTSLTSVNCLGTIEDWCSIEFESPSANPLPYANNLYINGELVTELVIPNTVTKINGYAFYNCTSLTSVTIPDSLTSIGSGAFEDCTGLTNVTIGDGVTSIGMYAFRGCLNLTSVTFEEGSACESIGDSAFYNCKSLTSIVIPDSVTRIGDYAFYGCTGLTIYCEATEKPSSWNSYWNSSNRPVYWYSENEPATEGNYWHYVDGVVTIWE